MYLPATPMRLIEAVGQELSELPKMVSADVISGIANMGVILIIMLLVTPFCTMMMLFGAITLGQLFTKYRALMAIVCYIGTGIVNGIIAFVIQIPVNMSMMTARYDPMKYYYNTYIISIILSLCMGVLFYFLSHMILTKKFDIE